jgi:hypothetical protein
MDEDLLQMSRTELIDEAKKLRQDAFSSPRGCQPTVEVVRSKRRRRSLHLTLGG